MRFRVLGPVGLQRRSGGLGEKSPPGDGADWVEVRVPGRRERQVLAMLLAPAHSVVTVDELIDALWDTPPPTTARRSLASHVSRLRAILDRHPAQDVGAIVSVDGGWRLDTDPGAVDAHRFEERAAATVAAHRRGRYVEASLDAEAGLAEWTGDAFQGHLNLARCAAESARLTRLRVDLETRLVDVRLAQGAGGELVAELESAVERDPLDERRWVQLMLAHYRSGNPRQALEDYQRVRRALVEQLGVEPGQELQATQRDVLDRSAALASPTYLVAVADRAVECPFKGLAPYGEADAGALVGRDRALAKALGMLRSQGMVCVTGPSGNGKTSLLRAGLVPAIRSGALAGSEVWPVTVLTPTASPCRRLERVLPAPDAGLLVVDQLEELFTLCTDHDERRAFADMMLAHADAGIRVALGVRGDFWADMGFHPRLADRSVSSSVFLGPLGEDDLRLLVVEGARAAGLVADDDLVEAVVSDAAGRPGILPHLSTALAQTWERRDSGRLRLTGYTASGGTLGSLAASAEEVYSGLDEGGRAATRRVLLRLVADGREGRVVRRRIEAADLAAGDDDAAMSLEALIAGRLLVAADDGLEVAHESLFVGWPRLARWIAADADTRRERTLIEQAAALWAADGRLTTDLLRGPRLTASLPLMRDADLVSARAREFLLASREASEDDAARARAAAARERRTGSRLRVLLVGVICLLVLALAAGGMALSGRDTAERARTEALAARLGAQSGSERRPDLGLLLAAQAMRLDPGRSSELALLSSLQRIPRALAMTNLGKRTLSMDLSPDGRTLAVGSNLGALWLLDADTLKVREQLFEPDGGAIMRVHFLDHRRMLYAKNDDVGSRLLVMDLIDGRTHEVARLKDVWRLEASPDGAQLAATAALEVAGLTRTASGSYTVKPLPLSVTVSNFSADGRRVARLDAATGHLEVVDESWRPVATYDGVPTGVSIELAPDGRTLAVADDANGTVHLIDTGSGRAGAVLSGPRGFFEDLAFSADGRMLAAGGDAGTITLWDVAAGTRIEEYPAGEEVIGVLFSPDGSSLWSVSPDGSIGRWDTTGHRGFGVTVDRPVPTEYAGWDQTMLTGHMVVTRASDGAVILAGGDDLEILDPATLAHDGVVLRGTAVSSLAMSTDGRRLAVATTTGALRVVDPVSWETEVSVTGLADLFFPVWDPTGRRLAVLEPHDLRVSVRDASDGAQLWSVQLPDKAYRAAWRGDRLAVSLVDGKVAILDATSGVVLRVLELPGSEQYFPIIEFLPDGTLVAGVRDGTVQLWDIDTGSILGLPTLVQPASLITQLAVVPDGRVVIGGGVGALLVDPRDPGAAPAKLYGTTASWIAVDARRDRVATWDTLGSLSVWDLDPDAWLAHACSVVSGPLDREEWSRIVGDDVPFDPACQARSGG